MTNETPSPTITLNDYQRKTAATAIYPHDQGVAYTALGLAGEAGEVANKCKKLLRGDKARAQLRKELEKELGDVLWYAARLAAELDLSLDQIARANLDRLADRQQRDTLTGDGDDR